MSASVSNYGVDNIGCQNIGDGNDFPRERKVKKVPVDFSSKKIAPSAELGFNCTLSHTLTKEKEESADGGAAAARSQIQFIQREHEKTLKMLHEEIARLQQRIFDLLSDRGINISVLKREEEMKNVISCLQTEVECAKAEIKSLKAKNDEKDTTNRNKVFVQNSSVKQDPNLNSHANQKQKLSSNANRRTEVKGDERQNTIKVNTQLFHRNKLPIVALGREKAQSHPAANFAAVRDAHLTSKVVQSKSRPANLERNCPAGHCPTDSTGTTSSSTMVESESATSSTDGQALGGRRDFISTTASSASDGRRGHGDTMSSSANAKSNMLTKAFRAANANTTENLRNAKTQKVNTTKMGISYESSVKTDRRTKANVPTTRNPMSSSVAVPSTKSGNGLVSNNNSLKHIPKATNTYKK